MTTSTRQRWLDSRVSMVASRFFSGFDSKVDNLAVPWDSVTMGGLSITEEGSEEVLRCVIGPNKQLPNSGDWLRFHSNSWSPVAQHRWIPVGQRHFLGAVGLTVELKLLFLEPTFSHDEDQTPIVDAVQFSAPTAGLSGSTVLLNIYDLAPALSVPNALLNNTVLKTFGMFHVAMEVYDGEWSYYATPKPERCGIFASLRPKYHNVHAYRQSVVLGETCLQRSEVRQLLRKRYARWRGGHYDMLRCNCIHFAEDFAHALGVKPLPEWVTGAHELGAGLLAIASSVGSTLQFWREDRQPAEGDE